LLAGCLLAASYCSPAIQSEASAAAERLSLLSYPPLPSSPARCLSCNFLSKWYYAQARQDRQQIQPKPSRASHPPPTFSDSTPATFRRCLPILRICPRAAGPPRISITLRPPKTMAPAPPSHRQLLRPIAPQPTPNSATLSASQTTTPRLHSDFSAVVSDFIQETMASSSANAANVGKGDPKTDVAKSELTISVEEFLRTRDSVS
jgi:hypothetical protein